MSLVVGICGGSGSGKTTLAERIASEVRTIRGPAAATVVSFDAYYHDQVHLPLAERAVVNYDHPDSLDGTLMARHIRELRSGHDVAVPVYDFASYTRTTDVDLVPAADVVIVEGILLFSFAAIREQLDLAVFRDCPEEVRFERRLTRDMSERGRTRESVMTQLAATVKPMHDTYVQPHCERADVVTRHGDDLAAAARSISERVVALDELATPASTGLPALVP